MTVSLIMFGFSVLHSDESVSVSAAFQSQRQVYTVYMDVYTMLNCVYHLLSFIVLFLVIDVVIWHCVKIKLI